MQHIVNATCPTRREDPKSRCRREKGDTSPVTSRKNACDRFSHMQQVATSSSLKVCHRPTHSAINKREGGNPLNCILAPCACKNIPLPFAKETRWGVHGKVEEENDHPLPH